MQNIRSAVKRAFEDAEGRGLKNPFLQDVFRGYQGVTDNKPDSVSNILQDLDDMALFVTDPEEVKPFEEFMNGVVVIDLAALGADDKTKNLLVTIFLNFFYRYMLSIPKKDPVGDNPKLRFIHSMLLVDEADNIMQYEFDVLKQILLQGREFGVGVLLSTQYLSHFKTQNENYLEPLLTWFLHKVPNINTKQLEGIGVTQQLNTGMVTKIKELEIHECFFKTLDVPGEIVRGTPFFEMLSEEGEV